MAAKPTMKAFPTVLALLAAAAAVVALVIQHQSVTVLQQEVAGLRSDLQRYEASQRKAASERSAGGVVLTPESAPNVAAEAERTELAKLREEVAALKKDTTALNRLAQAAQVRAAEAAMPTKLVPVADWKNAGRETPAAAAETVLWAATGGDVATLADGIVLAPSAREKAAALFASLPEQSRAEYGSPEKFVALMVAKDAGGVAGMQVLGQREISADDVGMRIRFGNAEGKTKDDTFVLHHMQDGWKLVIPDNPIDKWARQIKGGQ